MEITQQHALGDTRKAFRNIDLKQLRERQIQARIANSFIEGDHSLKEVECDFKKAILLNLQKLEKLRNFHEIEKSNAILRHTFKKQPKEFYGANDYDNIETQK